MIFKENNELKNIGFYNESELQKYFEKNLEKILGYRFIETEFAVGNFRIDTLAFDEESKSFKIIEFKNIKNHSLIDQGYTYLKLMLERKADFVLKYNEKSNKSISINEVDWSMSRIFFVSPTFTQYQLNATNFKDAPFDLIKITKHESDIYDIDFIKKTSTIKIKSVVTSKERTEVNKEIKVYTEEDHLNGKSDEIKEIYTLLRDKIFEMGDIDIEPKKLYIAFKGKRNIVDMKIQKTKIRVYINVKKGTLEDPYNISEDISGIGKHGNGDYSVYIFSEEDIEKVIPLIRQSIKVNGK